VIALTIAGSDPSGGAGIQADLRVFAAHGVLGCTAITALTVQDTSRFLAVNPVDPAVVRAQIEAVRADVAVAAIKVGMLATRAVADAVADALGAWSPRPPVVLDTPMVATSGGRLLANDAIAVLRERLLPLATLVTPNAAEARVLAGDQPIEGWAAGAPCAVLLTGGDSPGDTVRDVLIEGDLIVGYEGVRIPGGPFRGTGCTLSAAIAARLASGADLDEAVAGGIAWTRDRIAAARIVGKGAKVLV
jgi:hydroxymethylpyrimidine/phosphomethylpyrimidine kinase